MGLSRIGCVKRNVVLTAQKPVAYLFLFTVDPDVVETLSTLPGTFAPEVIA